MKKGDVAYVIVNNKHILEVKLVRKSIRSKGVEFWIIEHDAEDMPKVVYSGAIYATKQKAEKVMQWKIGGQLEQFNNTFETKEELMSWLYRRATENVYDELLDESIKMKIKEHTGVDFGGIRWRD